MFNRFIVAVALTVLAGPAAANWVYRAPEASDDLGSAYVQNAQGHRLDVGCGNGGSISIALSPDLRPANRSRSADVVIGVSIDGAEPMFLPASCGDTGCFQAYLILGSAWPVTEMQAMTRAMRAGSNVELLLGSQRMAQFTLAGSSAALGRLQSTTRCEGL